MRTRGWTLTIVAGLVLLPTAGCSTTKTKLSSCQRDKDQLLAQVAEQQRLVENLREQNQAVEDRLAESERLLARLHEQSGGGIPRSDPATMATGPAPIGPTGWKASEKK